LHFVVLLSVLELGRSFIVVKIMLLF
jgi:hypothetical protein